MQQKPKRSPGLAWGVGTGLAAVALAVLVAGADGLSTVRTNWLGQQEVPAFGLAAGAALVLVLLGLLVSGIRRRLVLRSLERRYRRRRGPPDADTGHKEGGATPAG